MNTHNRRLRNLRICLQASIDVIGFRISYIICVYIVPTIKCSNCWNFLIIGFFSKFLVISNFETKSFIDGKLGWVLTFLRSIMNEYSTGLCILASTVIRYCLVCHATRDFLDGKNMQTLCLAIIGTIVLRVAGILLEMTVSYRALFTGDYDHTESYSDRFLYNCFYFNSRSNSYNLRPFWDIIACLILPAFISGFIYIQICRVLLNRDRCESRNKAFSVTFFLDWLLWILCWSIYYFLITLPLQYGEGINELLSHQSVFAIVPEGSVSLKLYFCLF